MPSHNINVRKATAGDVDAIVDLNTAMAKELESRVLGSIRLRDGVPAVLDSTDKGFYVVGESGAGVVAVLHVIPEWNPWRNSFFWWVENVYVLPEWRRKGVYRAMHTFVHDGAEASPDVCGIRLFTTSDNLAARRTYEGVGMADESCQMFEVDFVFSSKPSRAGG